MFRPPNFETRVAILGAKAKEKGVEIEPAVLDYIATNITRNVRELEGSLTTLVTTAQLQGEPITVGFAAKALRDLSSSSPVNLTSKEVLRAVASYFELETGDILGSKRQKQLVYPRQVAMYLMRHLLKLSYPQIGDNLGGKDHTTIMHGVNKIIDKIKTDPQTESDVAKITQLLNKQ